MSVDHTKRVSKSDEEAAAPKTELDTVPETKIVQKPPPTDDIKNKAVREFIDKIPGILKKYLDDNTTKPATKAWSFFGGKKGKTRRMKRGRGRKGTKRR